MRLLLDTHVLVALIGDELQKLGRTQEEHLRDPRNSFYVSVVSLWEVAIKRRLGKLPLAVPLQDLPPLLDDLGLVTLEVAARHVLAEVSPEPATRDPFDRLLLAVCACEDLRLVTVDRALAGHPFALRPA